MSQVIYRKYRPQKFADLVNQEHIRKTLENEIKTGRLAHAYLFTGPRGIGKTTTARLVAKSVNCLNRQEGASEPCNKCSHCQQIMAGNFLDLIEIDAASHTQVDNVREVIIENIRFSPTHAKFKVFIIDEVHMLSRFAFNALLKTLEEPPAHVIFILATTEPHKIPETIISRCQRFDFKRVTVKDLLKRLQKIIKAEEAEVNPEVLETIAIRSEGCIRDAESLLQQVLSLGEKKIGLDEAGLVIPRSDQNLVIQFTQNLFSNDIRTSLNLISNLIIEGVDLERFLLDLIEFLRKILVFKSNPDLELNLTNESEEKLKNLATEVTNSRLTHLIELCLAKRKDLRQSEIPQLPLELLVLEFCESDELEVNKVSAKGAVSAFGMKFASGGNKVNNTTSNNPNNSSESNDSNDSHDSSLQAFKPSSNSPDSRVSNNSHNSSRQALKQSSAVTIADLKNHWPQILDIVREQNQSLCAFLKMSQIISLADNILKLGFSYKFHQDTIKEPKNKIIIEDCLSKITGQNLKIEVKTVETLPQPSPNASQKKEEDNPLINDLLTEFGGEVVE